MYVIQLKTAHIFLCFHKTVYFFVGSLSLVGLNFSTLTMLFKKLIASIS